MKHIKILKQLMDIDPAINGSTSELVKKSGIKQPILWRLLNKTRIKRHRKSTFVPLANYFGLTTDQLMGFESIDFVDFTLKNTPGYIDTRDDDDKSLRINLALKLELKRMNRVISTEKENQILQLASSFYKGKALGGYHHVKGLVEIAVLAQYQ